MRLSGPRSRPTTEVEVEVNLRPTVSRPGVRRPSGTCDQFFFLPEISFRQLRLCYFVAPFLKRGRICNLLFNCFLALPEQSLLGRSPTELTVIFYCLIWDSSNLEGQVPIFISPRKRVAQLYPRALGSLSVTSYESQGYGGGILTRLHTGDPLLLRKSGSSGNRTRTSGSVARNSLDHRSGMWS
jgi:hypothetical protein